MLPDRYQRFLTDISALVPQGRFFTDPLRTLAYEGSRVQGVQ